MVIFKFVFNCLTTLLSGVLLNRVLLSGVPLNGVGMLGKLGRTV